MKTLEQYKAEYTAAIKEAHAKDYVIKPEIWIYYKWAQDNNWQPWEPGAAEQLQAVQQEQPELFQLLISAHKAVCSQ